jgi:hypothetical protein
VELRQKIEMVQVSGITGAGQHVFWRRWAAFLAQVVFWGRDLRQHNAQNRDSRRRSHPKNTTCARKGANLKFAEHLDPHSKHPGGGSRCSARRIWLAKHPNVPSSGSRATLTCFVIFGLGRGSAKRGGEHSLLHKKSPADAELFLWSIGDSKTNYSPLYQPLQECFLLRIFAGDVARL